MSPDAYIIIYPISGGDIFNMVLSHHPPKKLQATQHDFPIQELQFEYKDFESSIKRITDMVPQTVSSHKKRSANTPTALLITYLLVSLASTGDWALGIMVLV